jgi:serine/threonine protein kinase
MNEEPTFGNTANIAWKPLSQQTSSTEGFGETRAKQPVEAAPRSSMLAGRYEVQNAIGRGGMGVVYLGKDHRMGEEVAIKFIPTVIKSDDAAISELKSETRKGLRLTHRNIVRMIELVEDAGDDPPAIIMEYIDGPTLSALRLKQPGQVFEVDQRLKAWVDQLLAALEYAHDTARIVHRDLKPANLMVNSAGQLKVTDFGIACSLRDSVSRVSVSANNTSGTLLYMSPQQMMGSVPSESDDIYALGATLYELLTSKPPFYSGEIAKQLELKRPPSLAERRAELGTGSQPIPPAWEAVIAACLEKEPQSRPISIAAVRAGLAGENFERGAKTLRGSVIRPGQAMPGAGTQRAQQTSTATSAPVQQVTQTGGNTWLPYAAAAAVAVGGFFYYQNGQEAERKMKKDREERQTLQLAEQKKRTLAEEALAQKKALLDDARDFEDSDATPQEKLEKFESVVSKLTGYDYPYDESEKSLLSSAEKKAEEWKDLIEKAQTAYDSRLTILKQDLRDVEKQVRDTPNLSAKARADLYSELLAANTGFIEGFGTEHTALFAKIEKEIEKALAEDKTQRPTALFAAEQAISDPRTINWKEHGRADLIKRVQSLLLAEPGLGAAIVADGKWNQATQDALLKYQDAKKLSPSGKIDLSTVNSLGLQSFAGAPEPTKPVASTSGGSSGRSSSGRSSSGGSSSGGSSGGGWNTPQGLGGFIESVGRSGIRPPSGGGGFRPPF